MVLASNILSHSEKSLIRAHFFEKNGFYLSQMIGHARKSHMAASVDLAGTGRCLYISLTWILGERYMHSTPLSNLLSDTFAPIFLYWTFLNIS